MRRAVLAGLTILTIALVTPLSVLAGALLGFAPTHWSGTALVDVEIPGIIPSGDSRSDAAAFLLDRAQRQDESDRGDLAPSWWDDDAGEVVLGAVTDRGEQMRRELTAGLAPPYRIERRAHSSCELQEVMDRAIELPEYGVISSGVDPVHNRVRLDVNRLSHGLVSTLHAAMATLLVWSTHP